MLYNSVPCNNNCFAATAAPYDCSETNLHNNNNYYYGIRKRQRRPSAEYDFVLQKLLKLQKQQQRNGHQNQTKRSGHRRYYPPRKSVAQPRPSIRVPARGIGPILLPNGNDVLSGRGGRINAHVGNVQFREMVNQRKSEYLNVSTKKLEKAHIAATIVREVRGMVPSGRFLKQDSDTGMWYDIGDTKAIKKVGQALREDAPDIRQEIVNHQLGSSSSSPPHPSRLPPAPMERAKTRHPKNDFGGEAGVGGGQPYLDGPAVGVGLDQLNSINNMPVATAPAVSAAADGGGGGGAVPPGSDMAFGMHFHDLGLVEGDTFGV